MEEIKKLSSLNAGNFDETKELNEINQPAKAASSATKKAVNQVCENEYVECEFENMSAEFVSAEDGGTQGDWQELKPKKDKFLFIETGGYTFTASDGTKIQVDDITNVVVKENKKTGEILIQGAKNANITGGSKDLILTVKDSTVNNIKTGKGSDVINIENSTVKEIKTGDGDNKVNISKNSEVKSVVGGSGNDVLNVDSSYVEKIDAKGGQDTINLTNSEADVIKGGKGADSINIENSKVKTEISGGDGDDFLHVVNSDVKNLSGNNGDDDILIENSNLEKIDGNSGSDSIIVNSSNVQSIYGGNDNDLIDIQNSNVQNVDGGWGADTINNVNSNISKIAEDKKDTINTENKKDDSLDYDLDSDTANTADEITKAITSKYSKKELTPEQEMQALTIDFFSQNLENMKEQLKEQESSDGLARGAYNWVRELLDLGVSKEDILKAIEEQEQMIAEFKNAMNGVGGESFEEVFKKWTGVEYNQENLQNYFEVQQSYSLLAQGLYKTQVFKEAVLNADNLGEVYRQYVNYFGDEELARQEINKMLKEAFASDGNAFGYAQSVEINEKGQLVVVRPKDYTPSGPMPGTEYETTVEDINDVTNMFQTMPRYFDLDKYARDFTAKFESAMGISAKELQDKVKVSQIETFGSNGAFQKLIDKYCATQDGFADKVSTAMQVTGIGLMVVGGVVTFFCPPAGYAMLEAGKYTALAGTFSDNAIDLFDDLTSSSGLSKEEAWENIKEVLTELALLYSGAKINGIAASAKDYVFTETQSKVLAFLAEVGTDTTLSLLTDLMITGDLDITGEGISQLLGIITGLAGAKIDAYTKEAFETADAYFKNNDFEGAKKYLKEKGIPESRIYNHYRSLEFEKINDIFKSTGSVEEALRALSGSEVLSKADINSLSSELKLEALSKNGIDISKYKGYNFNSAQGKLVAEDIDLYYKSLTEGIKIEDLMVPKMNNFDIALENTKIGAVFEVEGSDGIFIKTSSGGYKKLDISKEAYCKLFPALDRYSSGQTSSGDCYLVSVLNSMISSPEASEKLLSCFKENPDGSITVKMPNSDTEITIKPNQTIEDLGVQTGKHMTGSLGMQLLEYAYKVDLVNSKINSIDGEINGIKERMLSYYNDYMSYNDTPDLTFDEYRTKAKQANEELTSLIEKISGKSVKADNIDADFVINFFSYYEGIFFKDGELTERGLKALGNALGISPDNVNELNKIYTELAPKMEELGGIAGQYKIFSTYEEQIKNLESAKADIEDNDLFAAAEKLGGHGGHSSDVFSAFGLENAHIEQVDGTFFRQLIENPDIADGLILTAGTMATKADIQAAYNDPGDKMYDYYHKYPEQYQKALAEAPDSLPYGLVSNHAYSFEVRTNEITGEIEIVVTNPWSVDSTGYNKDIVLTVEQFKKCFANIYTGEL